MTEEEINKAIEVYYPGEDLGPRPQGFIDGAWWADEYNKVKRDEYAEEYAKAYVAWFHSPAARNFDLNSQESHDAFKESLKK